MMDRITGQPKGVRDVTNKIVGREISKAVDYTNNYAADFADSIGYKPVGALFRASVGGYNIGHWMSGDTPDKTTAHQLLATVDAGSQMMIEAREQTGQQYLAQEKRNAIGVAKPGGKKAKIVALPPSESSSRLALPMSENVSTAIVPYDVPVRKFDQIYDYKDVGNKRTKTTGLPLGDDRWTATNSGLYTVAP